MVKYAQTLRAFFDLSTLYSVQCTVYSTCLRMLDYIKKIVNTLFFLLGKLYTL